MAFIIVVLLLSLNHSATCEVIAIIPSGKLSRCDASLWLVEEDVEAITLHNKLGTLQWLAVAYAHHISATLTLCHLITWVDPVDIAKFDF